MLPPYAWLNLVRNPFGDLPAGAVGALWVGTLPVLWPGEVLLVRGAEGRGKSALLRALQRAHPGAVYERIEEGETQLRTSLRPAPSLLLIDEAQRLSRGARARLWAEAGALVLAAHADLSRECPRPCRVWWVRGLRPEALLEIVARRIEWARRGPGPLPWVDAEGARALVARFGDDLRAIEEHLYDRLQEMRAVGAIPMSVR